MGGCRGSRGRRNLDKLKFIVTSSQWNPYLWQKAVFRVPVVRSGCNFTNSYVPGAPGYRIAVVAGRGEVVSTGYVRGVEARYIHMLIICFRTK